MTHRIMRERRIRMKKTNFDSEAKSFFMNHMHANLINNKSKFDDTLMNVLEKFCDQILGIGMEEKEQIRHIDCLFENFAIIMSKTFTGNQGDQMISKQNANYLYRELNLSDRVPEFVRNVKKLIHDMDEYVHNPVKFIYAVNVILMYFEKKFEVSRDAKVAAATERRARSREKRLSNERRGGFSIGELFNSGDKTVATTSKNENRSGLNTAFKDLLTDFDASDAPLPVKENTKRSKKNKKSKDEESED